MTATPEAIEHYRVMAESCFKDAHRPENSMCTRADAAFSAVYMLCRVVMNGDDEALEHPSPAMMIEAWSRLGYNLAEIRPAIENMQICFEPVAEGRYFNKLMAIAAKLEEKLAPVQVSGFTNWNVDGRST